MDKIGINKVNLEFNRIIHVNNIKGDDLNGDGNISSPYKTIDKAMSVASMNNAIKLDMGVYSVREFKTMLTNKDITFIGTWNRTTIEIEFCPQVGLLEAMASAKFYHIQFTASAGISGDTRALYYYNSPVKLRFYNCVFKPNESRLPTVCFFYWTTASTVNRDVVFENCSFENINNLDVAYQEGSQQAYSNCVFTKNHRTGTQVTCLKNATLDNNFNVVSDGWQNSGTGRNPDGSQANLGVYGGKFSWGEWLKRYCLLKTPSAINTFDNANNLTDVILFEPLTVEDFEAHGFIDLSLITSELLSNLYKPKLLIYSEEVNPMLKIKAIPKPQLVKPTDDIRLKKLSKINTITLTSNKTGQGAVKIIFSVDSGVTWRTYNSKILDFEDIETVDINNVKEKGIDADTFNTLNTKWNEAVTEGKIRFAYYLEIENEEDIANVNKLEINMDLTGTWKKAIHGTDYDYEYDNENIYVTFNSDGSYKVNYAE